MKHPRIRKIALVVALGALAAAAWTPLISAIHRYQIQSVLNEKLAGRFVVLRMPSRALRRVNDVYVYTPPGYKTSGRRYRVIYLLHGCPGQGTDWFVKGRAHETAERLILQKKIDPVILVSFDAFGRGGPKDCADFLNSALGGVMAEDYVASELPRYIDAKFRTIRSPDSRALVGLSSGGYGAVNVGTKHQDVFHIIASHSGYFDPILDRKHIEGMLGPRGPLWDANDPHKQVAKWRDPSLRIYMDCGQSDDLLPDNEALDRELTASHVSHVFRTEPGAHHWRIWRARLPISLAYCDAAFRELAAESDGQRKRLSK